tara:strand:+ start:66 stop:452 length:387 start_codon:yes stop_codon:yes gene_type:complete
MTSIKSTIHVLMENVDTISHKITDQEYKNIVDNIQDIYNCLDPEYLPEFPMPEIDDVLIRADITWVDEFLTVSDVYGLLNHPEDGTDGYRYIGYSATKKSLQFIRVSSGRVHSLVLGCRGAIWNRVVF